MERESGEKQKHKSTEHSCKTCEKSRVLNVVFF